jgi:hypothetical protein
VRRSIIRSKKRRSHINLKFLHQFPAKRIYYSKLSLLRSTELYHEVSFFYKPRGGWRTTCFLKDFYLFIFIFI